MGRILAVDYGRKRTGLAVTDPLGMIANNLATIPTGEIWDFLKDYFSKEQVVLLVVGYPRQMNNQPSESVQFIDPFIKSFKEKYPGLPVKLMDERFTSKIAFQTMIDAGLGKKARRNKALIDSISATIILESYLDSQAPHEF
ncbi:MAG: Holliday junction resolvase RuvX [Bacteroidota bacterium]|nr:Holliday junction resolvase RuvX [Bacteroidota bacterium]MDP4225802.1 Holliday junction resolvase RuvX [Bacteroidota bacterium]MDP4272943.1 Holliday junction resolvase RuvX [Bacteroidota bacterium]